MAGGVPVILEIRFKYLVAVIVFDETVLLPETGNPPQKQICERIPSRNSGIRIVKRQITGDRAGAELASEFILLSCNRIGAKLQIVLAYNLTNVVAVRISGIRIVDSVGDISGIFSEPTAVRRRHQIDTRQNAVTITRKYIWHNKIRESRSLPVSHVIENDVIGRVTKHELIQQCG